MRVARRERMRTKAQRCRSCSTFPHLQLLRNCERSCNTPQLGKPLKAKAADAAPMPCMKGNSVTRFKKQRQPAPPPRTPIKKDGPAVNGCLQSIDEEAPNWQALIGTLVRIVLPSGVLPWCVARASPTTARGNASTCRTLAPSELLVVLRHAAIAVEATQCILFAPLEESLCLLGKGFGERGVAVLARNEL